MCQQRLGLCCHIRHYCQMPPLISCACVAPLPHAPSTALSLRSVERLLFQNLSRGPSRGWSFFLFYFFIFFPWGQYRSWDRTAVCHSAPWLGNDAGRLAGVTEEFQSPVCEIKIFTRWFSYGWMRRFCWIYVILTRLIFNIMTMAALIWTLMYIHCTAWKSYFRRCDRRTLILLDMNL